MGAVLGAAKRLLPRPLRRTHNRTDDRTDDDREFGSRGSGALVTTAVVETIWP
jgi:hypothetical protein